MFAPEGYVRWIDLLAGTRSHVDRLLLGEALLKAGRDPSPAFLVSTDAHTEFVTDFWRASAQTLDKSSVSSAGAGARSKFAAYLSEFEFQSELVTHCFMATFLLESEPLMCLPSGTILQAPEYAVLHMDRLDWCYWRLPVRETPEFSGLFELFDKGKISARTICERYCCIDCMTGALARKNNTLSGLFSAGHGLDSHQQAAAVFKKVVEPFLGASIVWKPESLPKDFPEALEYLGTKNADWWPFAKEFESVAMDNAPVKRGPKPTRARQEYYLRYPSGKPSDLSYDAIAAELTEAGFPISARSIQNYERDRARSID